MQFAAVKHVHYAARVKNCWFKQGFTEKFSGRKLCEIVLGKSFSYLSVTSLPACNGLASMSQDHCWKWILLRTIRWPMECPKKQESISDAIRYSLLPSPGLIWTGGSLLNFLRKISSLVDIAKTKNCSEINQPWSGLRKEKDSWSCLDSIPSSGHLPRAPINCCLIPFYCQKLINTPLKL